MIGRRSPAMWACEPAFSSLDELLERACDAWRVGAVEVDDDPPALVGDRPTEVQEVARDRPVLVVIAEIRVEPSREVELCVVGEEAADHLERPGREAGLRAHRGRVELVCRELRWDTFQAGLRVDERVLRYRDVIAALSDDRESLVPRRFGTLIAGPAIVISAPRSDHSERFSVRTLAGTGPSSGLLALVSLPSLDADPGPSSAC